MWKYPYLIMIMRQSMKKETKTAYMYLEGDPSKTCLNPTMPLPYGIIIIVDKHGKEFKIDIKPINQEDCL